MDSSSGNFVCVVAAKRGIKFFDSSFKKTDGTGNESSLQCSVAAHSNGNTFFSGDGQGNICIWAGSQLAKALSGIHVGAINAISFINDTVFTSGATDKILKVFDKDFNQQETYDLPSHARAIDFYQNKISVGCRDGTIIVIENGQQNTVMYSHATGETWGLEVDDSTGNVITAGDDNKILIFDPVKKITVAQSTINDVPGKRKKIGGASTLSVLPPNQQSRGVALSKANGHIAIGLNDGQL
jgi:WD40 repeat protein